ncbi:MAG: metallophosphoesterase [Deltaproteobacteria bacterium]|nr:metallophosphoesterase [Deltaproteobacteria bacterium]
MTDEPHIPRRWRVRDPQRPFWQTDGLANDHVAKIDGKALTEYDAVPVLVLLGEAGAGKTHELNRWVNTPNEAPILPFTGKGITLGLDTLPSKQAFKQWRDHKARLTIVLDALDEGTEPPHALVQRLAAALSGHGDALTRMTLRLSCRSTVFSDRTVESLIPVFGKEAIQTLSLAPLSKSDVCEYFRNSKRAHPEQDFALLQGKRLRPLLARPQLLNTIVRTLKRNDPKLLTVRALYREAIKQLLGDVEGCRSESAFDAACRVAAANILAQTSLEELFDHPSQLAGAHRSQRGPIEVSREEIVAIRSKGLFNQESSEPFDWSHRSWGEFLCAEWLVRVYPSLAEVTAILAGGLDDMTVLPEPINAVLGFVSQIQPNWAHEIAQRAPLAMLTSDLPDDPALRTHIVTGALNSIATHPALPWDNTLIWRLSGLAPTAMDEALAARIADRSRSDTERHFAIEAACSADMNASLLAAAQLALDQKDSDELRAFAISAIHTHGGREARNALRPLLATTTVPAIHRSVIETLWRRSRDEEALISFDELLDWLLTHRHTPERSAQSEYAEVELLSVDLLLGEIVKTFNDQELASLLTALGAHRGTWSGVDSHSQVTREVLSRIGSAPIAHTLARFFSTKDPDSLRWLTDETSQLLSRGREFDSTAISLAELLIRSSTEPLDHYDARRSLRLMPRTDLDSLLERVKQDEAYAHRWAVLAAWRFAAELPPSTPYESNKTNRTIKDMADDRSQSSALADATRDWFDGVAIDDPRYAHEREWAKTQRRRRIDAQAKWQRIEEARAEWLSHLPDDLQAFTRLVDNAHLQLRDTQVDDPLQGPLAETPFWRSLALPQQSSMLDAASTYLRQADPKTDEWFAKPLWHFASRTARVALDLLALKRPEAIVTLDWSRWIPAVITNQQDQTRGEDHRRLLGIAYARWPDALDQWMLRLIKSTVTQDSIEWGDSLCTDQRLPSVLAAIPCLLPTASRLTTRVLYGYWHAQDPSAAIRFARTQQAVVDDRSQQCWVEILTLLIQAGTEDAWAAVCDLLETNPRSAARLFAARQDNFETPLDLSRISLALIERMWTALTHDPGPRVWFSIGSKLFNELVTSLRNRADVESDVRATIERLPTIAWVEDYKPFILSSVSIRALQNAWKALSLDRLFDPIVREIHSITGQIVKTSDAANSQVIFAWLHISDIHFGQGSPEKQAELHTIWRGLVERVKLAHRASEFPLDAVLLTGDVAFSGQAAQYEEARKRLISLTQAIGLCLTDVYAVPGNHDVNRRAGDPDAVDGIRLNPIEKLASRWSTEDMNSLLVRQDAFWKFAANLAPVARQGEPFNGWWTASPTTLRDTPVQLLGVNTALLSSDKDEGNLALGSRQINDAIDSMDPEAISLLLSHHPFDDHWLKDHEKARTLQRKVSIHFSGHVHEGNAAQGRNTTGAEWHVSQEGATQLEGTATGHQFSIGAIAKTGDAFEFHQWPYCWDPPGQRFVLDTSRLGDLSEAPSRLTMKKPRQP